MSQEAVTVSQHVQYQDPETSAKKKEATLHYSHLWFSDCDMSKFFFVKRQMKLLLHVMIQLRGICTVTVKDGICALVMTCPNLESNIGYLSFPMSIATMCPLGRYILRHNVIEHDAQSCNQIEVSVICSNCTLCCRKTVLFVVLNPVRR